MRLSAEFSASYPDIAHETVLVHFHGFAASRRHERVQTREDRPRPIRDIGTMEKGVRSDGIPPFSKRKSKENP
jgi:hypothetical protein